MSHYIHSSACVICLALVRSKYDAILQSMPIDYERTLQVLQDSLTDEQICAILNTSGYSSANKKILDCMIERMSHTGDLLHLCDQLEQIMTASSDSTTVATVISQLKASKHSNLIINIDISHVIIIINFVKRPGTSL